MHRQQFRCGIYLADAHFLVHEQYIGHLVISPAIVGYMLTCYASYAHDCFRRDLWCAFNKSKCAVCKAVSSALKCACQSSSSTDHIQQIQHSAIQQINKYNKYMWFKCANLKVIEILGNATALLSILGYTYCTHGFQSCSIINNSADNILQVI